MQTWYAVDWTHYTLQKNRKKGLQMQDFYLKKSNWIEEQRIYDLLSVSLCSVAMCAFHMQMQCSRVVSAKRGRCASAVCSAGTCIVEMALKHIARIMTYNSLSKQTSNMTHVVYLTHLWIQNDSFLRVHEALLPGDARWQSEASSTISQYLISSCISLTSFHHIPCI